MIVSSETQAHETHDALKLVSLPPVDAEDPTTESSGSLQGILTGVVAGGVIWLGVLAFFV